MDNKTNSTPVAVVAVESATLTTVKSTNSKNDGILVTRQNAGIYTRTIGQGPVSIQPKASMHKMRSMKTKRMLP